MKRRIAAILLVSVLCIALLPSFARAETVASHQELAINYSPVWYQDVANLKEDAICKVDFDGDWVGNNNWENLDTCWDQGAVKGYVYTSVIETSTHYFITYADFHPRDWWNINSDLMSHENDMEGVQVVVRKDGSYYGEFRHRIDLGLLKGPIEPSLTPFIEDYIFVQKDKGLKMAKKDPLHTLPEPVHQGLWNQETLIRNLEGRAEKEHQEVPLQRLRSYIHPTLPKARRLHLRKRHQA